MLAGEVPEARYWACASAAALCRLPANDEIAAIRAELLSDVNRGTAKAARIPRIVMTTTNSMRVKPWVRERMGGVFLVSLSINKKVGVPGHFLSAKGVNRFSK
jgi:hypothetical protein